MVDWKQLADKWSELSKETQDRITAAMRQKYDENPTKFMDWLKEDPGRQIIWVNYAASVPPKFKVGDYVDVGPVYPPVRPGAGGLYESIVKVIDVIPEAPPALDKYSYTVEDTHGQTMTFLESAVKPAAAPPPTAVEKPVEVPREGPRFKVGDKVIETRTGEEYTVKDVSKWPNVLLEDKYGSRVAKDEYQLLMPEEYQAYKGEERAAREERRAPVPVPGAPIRGLSKDDMKRLQDLWNNEFFRKLGRVPPNSASTFRVEFEKVKDRTFDEAKEEILGVANDIIAEFTFRKGVIRKAAPPPAAPPRHVGPVTFPREEEGIPIGPLGEVPKVPLPKEPKSELPFPRSPTSEEREVLWAAFMSEMTNLGMDAYRWRESFRMHVLDRPYRMWGDVISNFKGFVDAVRTGAEVRFLPLATVPMPWSPEEEQQRLDAIVHFIATKLYPTMDELIYALRTFGVEATEEQIKEAAKKAWKENNVWFTSVPKEFIETLISEPVE